MTRFANQLAAGSALLLVLAVYTGCETISDAKTAKTAQTATVGDSNAAVESDLASSLRPAIDDPRFHRAAEYSADRGGVALMIVQGNDTVFAAGQNGHALDEPQPIHTASESFWGVLAAAAEIDGLLDLDEPAAFTLEEFAGVHWKQDIRIRQLLSYTSGLESGVWPLIRENPPNHFARALTLRSVAPPGARFQFGPSHLAVFGELLRRKLEPQGIDPVGYLNRRILDPIGSTVSSWRRDEVGNPDLAEGATLTAGEWSKFGRLLRDRGRWGDEVIIGADELDLCLVGSEARRDFGLALWLNPTNALSDANGSRKGHSLPDVVMAAGSGNQRLYVIRSLDLVVVRFGSDHVDWRDREFLERLAISPRERVPVAPRKN